MKERPRENDVSSAVIDSAFKVHTTLGPGLLEHVYAGVMAHELRRRGHVVATQVPIAIRYENLSFDIGFRADMVVDDLVIVELKSVENLLPVHKKQTLTYVRLSGKKLGLLLNFGAPLIKDGIVRLVAGLPD